MNRESITSLSIKIKKNNLETIVQIPNIDILVEVDAENFDDYDDLEFCITQKISDSEVEHISEVIESLSALLMPPKTLALVKNCIKSNTSNIFQDTNKGKIECLSAIEKLILNTSKSIDAPKGTKNLIYFSVYFDKGYVELMNNSLNSIIKHSTFDFDVLFITDKVTQNLISKQSFTKHIQPKYHITETPVDGVEASKNKTLIYDYVDIDMYDKILFLDCDIIAVGDVADIFNVCICHEKFYTARGENIIFNHHRFFHHGFDIVKQDFILEMTEAKQYPFNAGQFIFRNSIKMREHFNNLNWFMREWPGGYFFEQAFMCHYFCKAKITDATLNDKVALISTVFNNLYSLKQKILLHFTAPPLDAITKINFINNFLIKNYENNQ